MKESVPKSRRTSKARHDKTTAHYHKNTLFVNGIKDQGAGGRRLMKQIIFDFRRFFSLFPS